tara:strand:- start:59 stop:481 length:423 start_codon:yes stop_codon:yes gene_type:complete
MKKKKLKLKVPVSWTMAAMVEVEAYDLAEAVEVAKADFAQYGGEFLPEGKFVKNSYYVDFEAIDVHQDEQALQSLGEVYAETADCMEHHTEKDYGIGGYIDSEGTVYTSEQSKPLWDEVAEVERHRGLVIGEDGTVEKLV